MPYRIYPLNLGQNKNTIICVSGGCDSIAAAHFLKIRHGMNTIYHFNHGTKQSSKMEEKVIAFAKKFNFTLLVVRAKSEMSSEDDFRRGRFEYIEKSGRDFITAAHLDDANEGHYLRFIEGNPEYMPIPLATQLVSGGWMYHPFLTTDKSQFREYIKDNNLEEFVEEDLTNHSAETGRRAWVRNFLIPEMEKQGIYTKNRVKKRILNKTK